MTIPIILLIVLGLYFGCRKAFRKKVPKRNSGKAYCKDCKWSKHCQPACMGGMGIGIWKGIGMCCHSSNIYKNAGGNDCFKSETAHEVKNKDHNCSDYQKKTIVDKVYERKSTIAFISTYLILMLAMILSLILC